jgi:hypothetical protein
MKSEACRLGGKGSIDEGLPHVAYNQRVTEKAKASG